MPDTQTKLHIELRPFTSPCATCGADIDPEADPELNSPTFANPDRGSVCDACAQDADPAAFRALADLRRIDAAYLNLADSGAPGGGTAYLHALAQGLEEILTYLEGSGRRVRADAEWLDSDENHTQWATLWHGEEGPMLTAPTTRPLAEKDLERLSRWYDPDGNNPRPPGHLELIRRRVGPWRGV